MTVNNNFNAAYNESVVYDAEGNEHKCSRLNAIDLVRTSGYTWQAPAKPTDEKKAEEPVKEQPKEPVKEPVKEPAPVDHVNAPLSEIAEAVAGDADVEKYLQGFTEDALRTMAEERYSEKLHHKMKKPGLVSKIIELEEAKMGSEAD